MHMPVGRGSFVNTDIGFIYHWYVCCCFMSLIFPFIESSTWVIVSICKSTAWERALRMPCIAQRRQGTYWVTTYSGYLLLRLFINWAIAWYVIAELSKPVLGGGFVKNVQALF